MSKPKLLFICTANINRSRTAEDLFNGSDEYEAKSAGLIEPDYGGQVVTQELVDWADRIFVMDEINDQHRTRLTRMFEMRGKEVNVLGIPDRYDRGEMALVILLKSKLAVLNIPVS
mgnify:FL=1